MTEAETAALIAAVVAGDRAAFTGLVREYHTLVFRWALVVTDDPDAADDLAQEVWIKAYRGLAGYRGEAKFTTWLYRIAYNTAVESGRKQQRQSAALDAWRQFNDQAEEVVPSQDDLDQRRLAAVVRSFLSDLPPRQRAVFALADLDGVTTAEIAERLEIEEATVRVTLRNARRAIRSRLLQEEPGLLEDAR